jgi:PKHD-type hydroxylase
VLICVQNVLTKAEVAHCRAVMAQSAWEDGAASAGPQAAAVKKNVQLPPESPEAQALGQLVLERLGVSNLFISAALPLRILPPMFSRYGIGETFGAHVDNAIRAVPGSPARLRADLSATLFLAEPDQYDGGELTIETQYGVQDVKLPAGDLVVYPASSLHRVQPVTRGERAGSFFWIQSMVRDESNRTTLFDLDQTIQSLQGERGVSDAAVVRLTGIYHNLLRQWVEM